MNGVVKEIVRGLLVAGFTAGVTVFGTVQVMKANLETLERAVIELKAADVVMRIEFRTDIKQNSEDIQKIFQMAAERFQKFQQIFTTIDDHEHRLRDVEKELLKRRS